MKNMAQPDFHRLNFQRMDKTKFCIAFLEDEPDDRKYWLSQPVDHRIHQIEILRVINYGTKATSRLQRFFEVAERS